MATVMAAPEVSRVAPNPGRDCASSSDKEYTAVRRSAPAAAKLVWESIGRNDGFSANAQRSEAASSSGKRWKPRNPFPGSLFFYIPLRLFDDGLVADMSGNELKRYVTLLRLANFFYGLTKIPIGLKELEKADGVSARSAWLTHRKLQERGLIHIVKTRPFTYELILPELWGSAKFPQPRFRRGDSMKVQTVLPPVPWKD